MLSGRLVEKYIEGDDKLEQLKNLTQFVEESIYKILKDKSFLEQWPYIPVLPNVSERGDIEIERRIIRTLNSKLTQILHTKKVAKCTLTNTDLKYSMGEFISMVVLDYGEEADYKSLGKIFYRISDVEDDLYLCVRIQLKDVKKRVIEKNISSCFPFLRVQEESIPIEDIFDPEPKLVLIDFEWINYFKPAHMDKSTTPDQVSEYAIMAEGNIYNSDYLRVDSAIVKKIHKKLLDKQGVTKETLLERHKEGVTMYDEFNHNIAPLFARSQEENVPLIFLYFGREDGVILQQLFTEEECSHIGFVDFTALFHITQLGQEAILKGLGVKFLHTFDSAMDVKALYLILEVFRLAKTIEDSKNLQNAILIHKMYSNSSNPERIRKYQNLILAHDRTKELFYNALDIVEQFEKDGYFDGLSEFLYG